MWRSGQERSIATSTAVRRGAGAARIALLFVALLAAACLLAGCASFHTGRGDSAAARGNWDDAYASYRSALRSDPENAELKEKLALATQAAADAHRERGTHAYSEGRLAIAVAELAASLRYVEDAAIRSVFEEATAAKRIADARQANSDGDEADDRRDLTAARKAYEQAIVLDPLLTGEVMPKLQDLLMRIDEAKRLADSAQRAFDHGDFGSAESLAFEALSIHATQPRARSVVHHVEREHSAQIALAQALAAERARDWELAVARSRDAMDLAPNPDRAYARDRIEQQAFNYYARRSERAFDRREWAETIESIELARRYGHDRRALDNLLQAARYEREFELGDRAERAQDYRASLQHYRNAHSMRPSDQLSERIARVEQAVTPTPVETPETPEAPKEPRRRRHEAVAFAPY